MSNEEIAARLAAAIIEPSLPLASQHANVRDTDELFQRAAQLAVDAYRTVLKVLQQPQSS